MKVKYNKDARKDAGQPDPDQEESDIFDLMGGQILKVGSYMVMEVHDENGKLVEIPVEEYFKGIDINQFKQVIMDKVLKAFGPIIAQMNADEEDGEDLD